MTLSPALTRRAAAVVAVLASAIVGLAFLFLTAWMGALQVPDINNYSGHREVTLRVSVNSTDPLILTVYMKSYYTSSVNDSIGFMNSFMTISDIEFDDGYIQDENQTVVAWCPRTFPYGSSSDGRGHYAQHFIVCFLPANSEKAVTLDFNTTISSGRYCLTLSTHGFVFNSEYFSMP